MSYYLWLVEEANQQNLQMDLDAYASNTKLDTEFRAKKAGAVSRLQLAKRDVLKWSQQFYEQKCACKTAPKLKE